MLDIALEALARRDVAAALAAAEAAVAAEPQRAEARHALALALHMAGRHTEAEAAIDRALALAPDRAEFQLARASIALGRHDPVAVDAALGAAVAANPNALGAYLMAGHLALGRGQADEAERQLRLAQKVAPEHPQVLALEGAIAVTRNDHATAIRLLNAAAKDLPEDPLVLASLGLAYSGAGNHAFAEAALRRAIDGQPQTASLRWALIDSLQKQGRIDDIAPELDALLERQPEDRRALSMRAELAMRAGDTDSGLAAFRRLLQMPPFHAENFDRLLLRLNQAGMREAAVAMVEAAIERFPGEDLVWQRRLQATGGDPAQVADVLRRWRDAQPDSDLGQSTQAAYDEAAGDYSAAEANARAVLARTPGHPDAGAIVLRHELRTDPEAALRRLDGLAGSSAEPAWQRALAFWRGQALDALGRASEAVNAWQAAWSLVDGGERLPVPRPVPGDAAPASEAGPVPYLLWAPPGGRPREALALLATLPEVMVLDDRFGPQPRVDGLDPQTAGDPPADSATWRAKIAERGIDPAHCIDWLPHWAPALTAGMPDALLLAVIADPRDLLLNWLAYASPWPVRFPGADAAADWLAGALVPLAERIEAGDARVRVVRDRDLVDAPAALAEELRAALELPSLPDAAAPARARIGMGGLPTALPPGRWRAYRDIFGDAFARLAPLAQRLGYAVD